MPPKFSPNDRVQKVGGSYQAEGTVKAVFLADDGTPRYVFRFDFPAGMLHIFSENQLHTLDENALCGTCNLLMKATAPGQFQCVCGTAAP